MKFFFYKLTVFLAFVYVFQTLIIYMFPLSLPDEIKRFEAYLNAKPTPDIIYFGDSVIKDHNENDMDKRGISDMLKDFYPKYTIASMDHMAYHANIYEEYVNYLTRNKYKPKFIVVPINLRSFSPEWDRRPIYQFEKEKLFLKYEGTGLYPLLNFLLSFKVLDLEPISEEEFMNTTVFSGDKKIGRVKDFENSSYEKYSDQKMINKINYFYMYELSRNHRKLVALKNIKDRLKQSDIDVVFYVTPVDIETNDKFLKGNFRKQTTKNINTIKQVLGDNVLDLSYEIAAKDFNWKMYPNEHLKEKGRKRVAEKVAERIKNLLLSN